MREIKFDYVHDGLTVQWIPQEVRVAKIRCHVDEKVMPGPTRYSALIEVEPSGEYELTMLKKDSDAMAGPTMGEHSIVRRYLGSLGFYGLWRRAKRGSVKVVVNERGVLPATLKLEEVKMKEGVLQLLVTNPDGSKFHRTVCEFPNLDDTKVVYLEGKLIAFLADLNNDAAKSVAA